MQGHAMDPSATSRSRWRWLFRGQAEGAISADKRVPTIAVDRRRSSGSILLGRPAGDLLVVWFGSSRTYVVCEHTCRSTESRREFGAGADDCVSSRARLRAAGAGATGFGDEGRRGVSVPPRLLRVLGGRWSVGYPQSVTAIPRWGGAWRCCQHQQRRPGWHHYDCVWWALPPRRAPGLKSRALAARGRG
jgi:hypothetical protein